MVHDIHVTLAGVDHSQCRVAVVVNLDDSRSRFGYCHRSSIVIHRDKPISCQCDDRCCGAIVVADYLSLPGDCYRADPHHFDGSYISGGTAQSKRENANLADRVPRNHTVGAHGNGSPSVSTPVDNAVRTESDGGSCFELTSHQAVGPQGDGRHGLDVAVDCGIRASGDSRGAADISVEDGIGGNVGDVCAPTLSDSGTQSVGNNSSIADGGSSHVTVRSKGDVGSCMNACANEAIGSQGDGRSGLELPGHDAVGTESDGSHGIDVSIDSGVSTRRDSARTANVSRVDGVGHNVRDVRTGRRSQHKNQEREHQQPGRAGGYLFRHSRVLERKNGRWWVLLLTDKHQDWPNTVSLRESFIDMIIARLCDVAGFQVSFRIISEIRIANHDTPGVYTRDILVMGSSCLVSGFKVVCIKNLRSWAKEKHDWMSEEMSRGGYG